MKDMVFCTECGKKIDASSNYCIYCGAPNIYHIAHAEDREKHRNDPNKNEKPGSSIVESDHDLQSGSSPLSYFTKHWQGKLSLATSYWINNVLLNIIFVVVIAAMLNTVDLTTGTVWGPVAIIVMWILSFFLTIWSLVGLWRSAGNHIKKYRINVL